MRTQYNTRVLADPIKIAEVLSVDPETGVLVRKTSRGKLIAGSHAGRVRKDGYLGVSIFSRSYLAHRVVWCLVYGQWPDGELDHIDGNRLNNSINNLRLATPTIQNQNRIKNKNNTSGCRGIFVTEFGKFKVVIGIQYKRHHVGTFDTIEAALEARERAEIAHHPYRATDKPVDIECAKARQTEVLNLLARQREITGGRRKDNKSGITGVSWHKRMQRWVARIGNKQIGAYENFDAAVTARKAAEIQDSA